MLRQLFIAGNQIAELNNFDRLSSLPALVEISVARNPVSDLANLHEHIISQFRQLQTIDGTSITQRQRQSAAMLAAKRRLDLLEEQVSLQDGNIEEMGLTQQHSERVLQGVERLLTAEPTKKSTQGAVEAADGDVTGPKTAEPGDKRVAKYLAVVVESAEPHGAAASTVGPGEAGSLATVLQARRRDGGRSIETVPGSSYCTPGAREPSRRPYTNTPSGDMEGVRGLEENKGAATDACRAWPEHAAMHEGVYRGRALQESRALDSHELLDTGAGGRSDLGELSQRARQLAKEQASEAGEMQQQASEGGDSDELRQLVKQLAIVCIPAFDKMMPPFRDAIQREVCLCLSVCLPACLSPSCALKLIFLSSSLPSEVRILAAVSLSLPLSPHLSRH